MWPDLKMNYLAGQPLASLTVEGCARAPGCPQAFSFPPRSRVLDSPVHSFRIEPQRVRYAHDDELAIHERKERIGSITGDDWRVSSQAQGVELIDPIVIVGISTPGGCHATEVRPRGRIKR